LGISGLFLVIFVIAIIASFSANDTFAQIEEPIVVTTAQSSYREGEIIIITGQVRDRLDNTPVSLTVYAPDGLIVALAQAYIDSYNKFRTEITAGGTMIDEGTYTIKALYGSAARTAETTFDFVGTTIPSSIAISTDKSTYDHSSMIFVNGKVTNPRSGTLVTLIVIGPTNDIITIDQLSIDTYGNFNTSLSTVGNIWAYDGTYTIQVQYGNEYIINKALVELTGGTTTVPCGPNQVYQLGVCQDIVEIPKLLSSNQRIVDDFGNAIHSVSVGQQVQITTDLENQNNFDQSFVFYFEVRETLSEGWITGSLAPRQSFSPALSWTPDATGTYTFDITIFDDMQRRNVLAPTITISQVVDDSGGGIPTSPNTVFIPSGSSVPGCELTNECFIPAVITVNVGDTVKWENKDSAAHTVTSGTAADGPDGNFDSNMFLSGQTFSHTFRTAGEYPYFDMLHPWQAGIVIVKGTPSGGIVDTVPPLLLTPSDMTIDATDSSGARVDYSVKAIDDNDGILRPNCSPSPGSLFPIGKTTVTCSATDYSGNSDRKSFLITVNPPDVLIPSWIKDVAGFWCGDEIDNASFIEAIQYLINNDVILVPATASSGTGVQEIPNWVKSNACWWSQGLITNSDFASGLQYLIGQGIIRV